MMPPNQDVVSLGGDVISPRFRGDAVRAFAFIFEVLDVPRRAFCPATQTIQFGEGTGRGRSPADTSHMPFTLKNKKKANTKIMPSVRSYLDNQSMTRSLAAAPQLRGARPKGAEYSDPTFARPL
jgi:hypothetical protein